MDSSLAHLVSWSEPTKGDVPPALTVSHLFGAPGGEVDQADEQGPSITISPLPAPHPPTVFLFGGKYVHSRRLTNEMWAMDLGTRVWERVDAGDGPRPRYFHSMDTWQNKLVCFGGMSDTDPLSVHDDIWFFDCATRRWLIQETNSPLQDHSLLPSPRYAHLSAISRGKLVVSGGQHADNTWVYEINVYDLNRRQWVSKTVQPEMQGLHSKGAYRSVAASSSQRVISPSRADGKSGGSLHSYAIDEDGEGGDIVCYSNYDFAKVRRELDIISPDDASASSSSVPTGKDISPPGFAIRDDSPRMLGPAQPPGLRFPNGGIIGHHFILCGLYLASTSAAFAIWAMDLRTLTWRQLEPAALSSGSWNRAIIWPERAKLIVFGNADLDLASDYAKRAVNLDHMAVVNLETYGIYRPPKLVIPAQIQEAGLTALDEKLASDFEVVSEDGRRIKCAKAVLRARWSWFAEQEQQVLERIGEAIRDPPAALDINDTLLGSFTPARLAPSHLTIPEPFPVCVALVQYFYTLSISTPLQNRAPVLSALLFLAKQYKIDRLARLVVHALHERLEPPVAVGIYEIATLSGEQGLQIRALQMIHAAKNAAAARCSRQNPPQGQAIDTSGTAASVPPAGGPATSTSNGDAAASTRAGSGFGGANGSQRQALCESILLGDEAAHEIDTLLEALRMEKEQEAFHEDVARPESPLEPIIPRRESVKPPGSSAFPDRRDLPLLPWTRGSPRDTSEWSPALSSASSDSTTSYPRTPALTVDDDDTPSVGVARSLSGDSAAGQSEHWTPRLSKDALPPANKRSLQSTAETATQPVGLGFGILPARGSSASMTLGHSRQSSSVSSVYSHTSRSSSSSRPANSVNLRHSSSISTQTSSDSLYRRAIAGRDTALPALPEHTSTPFDFDAYSFGSGSKTTTTLSFAPSISDTMSISSGSTGTSSQKAAKAEKKAMAAAEKAQKKAEAREKFEALRAEQRTKMAVSQAEAQRKAETAKLAPVKLAEEKAQQPKSKFGKFGAKLAGAVLFPEGGKNSTMF